MKPSFLAALALSVCLANAAWGQTPDTGAPPAASPTSSPPSADAPALPNPLELIDKALNPPSPDGKPVPTPRVLRGSGSRAGGPANELNTGGQVEPPEPPKGQLGAVVAGRQLFHGNYCGKGQRGAGLPPIDALDAACMRHDACYEKAGYPSCDCDGVLRADASAVADDTGSTAEVRRRALSVLEAAGAMSCRKP